MRRKGWWLSREYVWSKRRPRRPLANRFPPPARLLVKSVLGAYGRLRWYLWYPIMNPRLTALAARAIAIGAIAAGKHH